MYVYIYFTVMWKHQIQTQRERLLISGVATFEEFPSNHATHSFAKVWKGRQ